MIDAKDRFAEASMTHHHIEPAHSLMQRLL
jgi:hypothetical protein